MFWKRKPKDEKHEAYRSFYENWYVFEDMLTDLDKVEGSKARQAFDILLEYTRADREILETIFTDKEKDALEETINECNKKLRAAGF